MDLYRRLERSNRRLLIAMLIGVVIMSLLFVFIALLIWSYSQTGETYMLAYCIIYMVMFVFLTWQMVKAIRTYREGRELLKERRELLRELGR